MLKFNYVINLGLATVLVVPAVTLGAQRNDSLEGTLQRTIAALEELAGIEARLQARDATAIPDVLRLTEAPAPAAEPGAEDAKLEVLRDDVAGLQRRLDSHEASDAAPGTAPMPSIELRHAEPRSGTTVGLDEVQLAKLASAGRPIRVVAPSPATSTKTAYEEQGYTADPARLGRALYRQNRYDEALAAFEACGADPEARYWRARCLEKSSRAADALAAYEKLAGDESAAPWSARAAADLEFLRWRASAAVERDGLKRDGANRDGAKRE